VYHGGPSHRRRQSSFGKQHNKEWAHGNHRSEYAQLRLVVMNEAVLVLVRTTTYITPSVYPEYYLKGVQAISQQGGLGTFVCGCERSELGETWIKTDDNDKGLLFSGLNLCNWILQVEIRLAELNSLGRMIPGRNWLWVVRRVSSFVAVSN
jgi:hypothetical protein